MKMNHSCNNSQVFFKVKCSDPLRRKNDVYTENCTHKYLYFLPSDSAALGGKGMREDNTERHTSGFLNLN